MPIYHKNIVCLESREMDLTQNLTHQKQNLKNRRQIRLIDFVGGIRDGHWKEIIETYRSLQEEDKKTYKEKKIPAVSLSGCFATTKQDSLVTHSGLLQIDIDLKTPELREQYYEKTRKILENDPFVVAIFQSPSGGIKCIFHMGKAGGVEEHTMLALGVSEYLLRESQIPEHILDRKTRNLGCKCLVSYDPNLYLNLAAEEFINSEIGAKYVDEEFQVVETRNPVNNELFDQPTEGQIRIANSVLRKACEAISTAKKGTRYDTRMKYAYTVGGYDRCLDTTQALAELIRSAELNTSNPLKAKKNIEEAYESGAQKQFEIKEKGWDLKKQIGQFYQTNDTESRQTITEGEYLSQQLNQNHCKKNTITDIIASTGSGKMIAIHEIQKMTDEPVIHCSFLRRLCSHAVKELNAFGFEENLSKYNPDEQKIFSITIDSLTLNNSNKYHFLKNMGKNPEKKVCLVLDEIHRVAETLFELGKKTLYPDFIDFCRLYVNRIITLTATETTFSRKFSNQLAKDLGFQHERYFFKKSSDRINIKHLEVSKNDLNSKIVELIRLKNPHRCLCLLQIKKRTTELKEILNLMNEIKGQNTPQNNKEICLIHAESSETLDENSKLIIGSPSLGTGISIHSKVDLCIIYLSDQIFQPHDLEQYSARIRNPENTEFIVITDKKNVINYSNYNYQLKYFEHYQSFFEYAINEETVMDLSNEELKKLNELTNKGSRLLEFQNDTKEWKFHPLFVDFTTSNLAYRKFVLGVGAGSFIKYLQEFPHPDYSFNISECDEQIPISTEVEQIVSETLELQKTQMIEEFENVEPKSTLEEFNLTNERLQSANENYTSCESHKKKEFLEEKQNLENQSIKTQAQLNGVDTTGMNSNRARQEITKRSKLATMFTLIKIAELKNSDLMFQRILQNHAIDENLYSLNISSKWNFAKTFIDLKNSNLKNSVKYDHISKYIQLMEKFEFESVFELKKSNASSSKHQNERMIVNKLMHIVREKDGHHQKFGIDYRLLSSMLTELKLEISYHYIIEFADIYRLPLKLEVDLNDKRIIKLKKLLSYSKSLNRCGNPDQFWSWFLRFKDEFEFLSDQCFESDRGVNNEYIHHIHDNIVDSIITTEYNLKRTNIVKSKSFIQSSNTSNVAIV